MKGREIDIVEATDIDHDGFVPRFIHAATERLHPTDFTEEVSNFLFVKSILREHLLLREEREAGGWDERQDKSLDLAVRAVAGKRLTQVRHDLVPHRLTMTPARIFLHK